MGCGGVSSVVSDGRAPAGDEEMTTRSFGAALVAVVCALSLSTGVHAGGGDAKQIRVIPATCTVRGTGTVGFNKSGTRVTLNVSVAGVARSGWRITVRDTAAGVLSRTTLPAMPTAWSALVNYGSPKGTRTVTVVAASTTGTTTCSARFSYRV